MQAIYPGSELRTVRCLQENSALCELLGIHPEDITKDTLYRSVRKLWDIQASWMADCLVLAIVVMDAGFSSEENLEWLRTNGYDYITVMRSRGVDYTCESDVIEKSTPESGSSGLLDCLNHRKSLPKNRVVELEGVRRCESHSVG